MQTIPSPFAHDFKAEVERILATETRSEHLHRLLDARLKEYSLQVPEHADSPYAISAQVLEAHIALQPVCLAAIQLLKNDHDNLFPESLAHSLGAALRAIPSHGEKDNYFHTLLSALNVPILRDASLEACKSILCTQSQSPASRELREFAREIISLFRRSQFDHPLREHVKGVAHNIFTVGQSMPSQPESPVVANSSSVTNHEANREASQILLKLFMQRPPQITLDRLTIEDFKRVGELSGLSLEEFKVTAETLSRYASRDGGALDAFLRIAKSPHDAAVSMQTRTQALAGFLATYRRRGSLSFEVERKILATSAEIPELPFLADADVAAGEPSAE